MEAIIFPRRPGIFKETRDLQTLLLSGISYLTGDLLLRERPLGTQAGKSQSQPPPRYTVPTPPLHSGSLHMFEEQRLQMCVSAEKAFHVQHWRQQKINPDLNCKHVENVVSLRRWFCFSCMCWSCLLDHKVDLFVLNLNISQNSEYIG